YSGRKSWYPNGMYIIESKFEKGIYNVQLLPINGDKPIVLTKEKTNLGKLIKESDNLEIERTHPDGDYLLFLIVNYESDIYLRGQLGPSE
ncbi:hypothetical protein BVY01_01170, partial [bacterium I07]